MTKYVQCYGENIALCVFLYIYYAYLDKHIYRKWQNV